MALPDEETFMVCDPHRIEQALGNLVANAIKFTPAGGTVRIEMGAASDHVFFRVSDTGPGISPEHASEIFRPFWQAPDAPRQGVGLGLAIARGIVEAHGGSLTVESAPGAGATFSFSHSPSSRSVTSRAGEKGRASAWQCGERLSFNVLVTMEGTVLVVDDDLDIRATLAQILREEGFRVREARNGLEALEKVAEEEPDLVLLDLVMPVIDGWEVLRTLRAVLGEISSGGHPVRDPRTGQHRLHPEAGLVRAIARSARYDPFAGPGASRCVVTHARGR